MMADEEQDYFGEDTVCDFLTDETVDESPPPMPVGAYLGKKFPRQITYVTENQTAYTVQEDGVLARLDRNHIKKTEYDPENWGIVFRSALKDILSKVNQGNVAQDMILEQLHIEGKILDYMDVKNTLDNKLVNLAIIVFKGQTGIACSAPLVKYRI